MDGSFKRRASGARSGARRSVGERARACGSGSNGSATAGHVWARPETAREPRRQPLACPASSADSGWLSRWLLHSRRMWIMMQPAPSTIERRAAHVEGHTQHDQFGRYPGASSGDRFRLAWRGGHRRDDGAARRFAAADPASRPGTTPFSTDPSDGYDAASVYIAQGRGGQNPVTLTRLADAGPDDLQPPPEPIST